MSLSGAIFAACDKNDPPVFDDKYAFVAFDESSMTVSEDSKDVVRIPVSLASVKGLTASVSFTVNAESSTAKEGVSYELLSSTGVLSFDAENRTQYIEVQPIYYDEYTGDLKLVIDLVGNENMPVSAESECTVTFSDIDHPLSFILGDYTVSGTSYWYGAMTWTMEIRKDEDDDSKVWFFNLFGNSNWAISTTMFYGNVNEDKTKILIPFGQTCEYKYGGTANVYLYGIDSSLDAYDTGSWEVDIVTDGDNVSLDFGDDYGLWVYIEDTGSVSIMYPGISAEKN